MRGMKKVRLDCFWSFRLRLLFLIQTLGQDRHLETSVDMSFSYMKLSMAQNRLQDNMDDVFTIVATNFRVVPSKK